MHRSLVLIEIFPPPGSGTFNINQFYTLFVSGKFHNVIVVLETRTKTFPNKVLISGQSFNVYVSFQRDWTVMKKCWRTVVGYELSSWSDQPALNSRGKLIVVLHLESSI